MKKTTGRNGGTLYAMEPGDKPPVGAGRPKNLFKHHIREMGDGEPMDIWGIRLDVSGMETGERVMVRVKFPAAMAVVVTMYRRAQKGDVQAAKWLSETAYGKNVKLGEDEESPLGAGFAVILPGNGRGGV